MTLTVDQIFKDSPLVSAGNADHFVDSITNTLQMLPLSAWPMQSDDGRGHRPAMVNDPDWPKEHSWSLRSMAFYLTRAVRVPFQILGIPTEHWRTPMLSVVMPGREIAAHRDRQEETWLGRLHLPVLTNPDAMFFIGDRWHTMERGTIYLVDVRQPHAVRNDGLFPRVHLMVDLHSRSQ